MTVGCIIQTRMGSTRLPGKVLLELKDGKVVLDYVINQLRFCETIDKVVVATTTLTEDDKIAEFCSNNNIECFRGDSKNVLDRHYQCAKKYSLTTIIRMPSDKPLLDPKVVDNVVKVFNSGSYDYVTNFLPSTTPGGTEVEVFSFNALEKSWNNATLPSEKEHVTNHMYNHKDEFRIFNVKNEIDLSKFRWVVDREEDYILVKQIISKIDKEPILIKDIIELFNREPKLVEINAHVDKEEGNLRSEKEDSDFLKSIDVDTKRQTN